MEYDSNRVENLKAEIERLELELKRERTAKETALARENEVRMELHRATRMRRDPILWRDQPTPTSRPPESIL
jgi:hypothetical protein